MKKKRTAKVGALALALAMGLALAGCSQTPAESSAPSTAQTSAPSVAQSEAACRTVTDMKGREVTLGGPADKVVAVSAADCEILFALGAGDTLVGRGEYCNYPEAVLEVPVVQSGSETNVEEIIALGPQVVLMNTMAQTLEQVEQLENAGITVLASEATDVEGVYAAIAMIGKAVGKDSEAEALVQEMKTGFQEVMDKVPADGEPKSVYFEVSPLEYGLWTAGGGTFMDEIATMMGLENAFGDVEGWAEVSEEQVLERNPDYIVTIAMYFGEGPKPEEEILGRAGWGEVMAVKEGNVFALSEDEMSRPGPRLVEGARAFYDAVYGSAAQADEMQAA